MTAINNESPILIDNFETTYNEDINENKYRNVPGLSTSDDSNSRDTNSDSEDTSNYSKNPDSETNPKVEVLNYWAPWAKSQYKDDTSGLHQEIEEFVHWVSPTTEERKMRQDLVARIEYIVQELWKGARVEVIGSYKTELCVPTSDIDLVIFGAQKEPSDLQPLFLLSSSLKEYRIPRGKVKVITTAKVPILKFIDFRSGCSVDVAFEINTGLENTKIVQSYLNQYPLLRPLTLVIKTYLKQCFMNDTWTGGIGSYTLVILITSYLQKHTQLKGQKTDESENLADLLIGFFDFYGRQFDYKNHVISVKDNCYYEKTKKNWYNPLRPEMLSVEDPLYPDIDVGSLSFKIDEARIALENAYHTLTICISESQSSFLNAIIPPHFSLRVVRFRECIKIAYSNDSAFPFPPRKNKKPIQPQGRFYRRNVRNHYDENKNHYNDKSRIDMEEFPSLATNPSTSTSISTSTPQPMNYSNIINSNSGSNPLSSQSSHPKSSQNNRRTEYSEVVSKNSNYYSKQLPKNDKPKYPSSHKPDNNNRYYYTHSHNQKNRNNPGYFTHH